MPSTDAILAALTAAANEWRGLAIVWHALLTAFVVALLLGWRPSIRVAAALLATPLASVALTAVVSGNPFNAIVFLALSTALAISAFRLPSVPLQLASGAWILRAAPIVVLGAVYPHFLRTASWIDCAFASPFGLIPCPTLLVVLGMTLAIANLRSVRWAGPLLLTGVLYAAIGVFVLGVMLDWGLFVAVALFGAAMAETHMRNGHASEFAGSRERDELLDRFMPRYDVVERHSLKLRRRPT